MLGSGREVGGAEEELIRKGLGAERLHLHEVVGIGGVIGGVPHLNLLGIVGGIAAGLEGDGLGFAGQEGRDRPVIHLAVIKIEERGQELGAAGGVVRLVEGVVGIVEDEERARGGSGFNAREVDALESSHCLAVTIDEGPTFKLLGERLG